MSLNWATYQAATGCTKYGPAGGQALATYTEDVFAELHRLMGICNCRPVVGGSAWSHHAECRAVDTGFVIRTGKTWAYEYTLILGEHGARVGIDHIITNRRPWESGRGAPMIFSARSPNGRVYTGTHPHKDHNHNGLTRNAGLKLTYATLVSVYGTPTQVATRLALTVIGDEDMFCKKGDNSMTVKYWQRRLTRLGQDLSFAGGPPQGIDGVYGSKTTAAVKAVVGASTNGEQIFDLEAEAIDAKILGASGVFTTKAEFDTHRHPEGTTGAPT